jgi:hypothetical protein
VPKRERGADDPADVRVGYEQHDRGLAAGVSRSYMLTRNQPFAPAGATVRLAA